MPKTIEQRLECLEQNFYLMVARNAIVSPATDNYVIKKKEGLIVLPTAAANARDVVFPDPKLFKNRPITVVNMSGNSQNILSHDGTTATIKPTSSAAAASHAVENSTSNVTGRRTFVSDGTVWVQVGI